jgi:hypothetical protein
MEVVHGKNIMQHGLHPTGAFMYWLPIDKSHIAAFMYWLADNGSVSGLTSNAWHLYPMKESCCATLQKSSSFSQNQMVVYIMGN